MASGPAFKMNGDLIPVDIKVKPLHIAIAALEDHEKTCPGTALECYTSGRHEERRRWLDKRDLLRFDIELARAYPNAKAKKINPQRITSPDRYVKEFENMLKALDNLTPGTQEWRELRHRAMNKRFNIHKVARENGKPIPELSEVPPIPRA